MIIRDKWVNVGTERRWQNGYVVVSRMVLQEHLGFSIFQNTEAAMLLIMPHQAF